MGLASLIAFLTTLLLTPLAAGAAWRAGAISHPDGARRLQARSTPLWGGAAVLVGLCLGVSVTWGLGVITAGGVQATAALTLSAGLICLLGCYDDLRAMSASGKLAGQIFAVLPILLAGIYVDRVVLFDWELELGWLGGPLTIAWLILGINAMNLIDGIDGLASLTGILVSLAIAAIAANSGATTLATLAVVLAAALAGFLVHNRPPAKIYLGDAGSMLIGLLIAAMAAQIPADGRAAMNLPVAGLLLLLPLADTGLAILRRTLRGQSFAEADRGHIHHCLLARGFSVGKTLRILGGLCLANGCLAWLAAIQGEAVVACTIVAVALPLLVYVRVLGHQEWRLLTSKLAGELSAWRAGIGNAEAAEKEVAASPSKAARRLGATIPEPHFHRNLQPSGHAQPTSFEAAEARPSPESRDGSTRQNRIARRPR